MAWVNREAVKFDQRDEYFRVALSKRVARMQKLLDQQAPSAVVGNEAWLIFKAALAWGGEPAGRQFLDELVGNARNASGFCAEEDCDNKHEPEHYLCSACIAKHERILDSNGKQ